MKLWQGLGYYSRARNLQKAARVIVSEYGGELPRDYAAVRALSGVGDYTAGAICSIAFGLPVPAVDGNVLRVMSRVNGDRRDVTRAETKKAVGEELRACMPTQMAGEFNQALMELGATVCLPNGAPLCGSCPLQSLCRACREGTTAELPVKSPKKARRVEERTVYLIFCEGRVALRQRGARGLLAGLWEFPNELSPWDCPVEGEPVFAAAGKHIFTHIEWRMSAYVVETARERLPNGWVWASRAELAERYPVPNAFAGFFDVTEKYLTR